MLTYSPHPMTGVASRMFDKKDRGMFMCIRCVTSTCLCTQEKHSSVASKMCASSKNVNILTPSHDWRSIKDVWQERPRHVYVHQMRTSTCLCTQEKHSSVASKMCASSKNVNILTPSHDWRSIKDVWQERPRHVYVHQMRNIDMFMYTRKTQ